MGKAMRKMFHRFFINDRGAVSIYLIIVALLLLIFNLVLIDYARVLVAKKQTEQAAQTALRSTMAAYDKPLQDKGLFAFDGDNPEAENLFTEVFEKNLEAGDGNGYKFVDINPEIDNINLEMNFDRGLSNKDVLKHQILEDMKYTAPIELGEALLNDFLSVSEEMEQASDYVDLKDEIDDDVESRDDKLEKAKDKLEEANNEMNDIESNIKDGGTDKYPEVNTLWDIFDGHLKYLDAYKDGEGKEKADEFQENAKVFVDEKISTVTSVREKLVEVLELIEDAEGLNSTIEETIKEQKENGKYDEAKEASDDGIDIDDEGGIEQAIESLDDYVLEDDFFEQVKEKVISARDKIESEDVKTNELKPKLEEIEGTIDGDFSKSNKIKNNLSKNVEHAIEYYENIVPKIEESYNLIDEALEKFKSGEGETGDDEDINEEEEKADDSLEEIKDEMDDLEDEVSTITGDNDIYERLNELSIEYGGAIEENEEDFDLEDKDNAASDSMSFIDMLFENLGHKLVSARDELYINEYILTRFAHHDPNRSGSDKYAFKNNQVEYIIYGQNNFGANYTAAMGEIFGIRFGINLVGALLDKKNKIFGPYAWVAALATTFSDTIKDMSRIKSGKSVSLFPKNRNPRVDYKDHLRLFLFAHPEGKRFERLMAVIHNDTKSDLKERSTYATANVSSSVDLWFLPHLDNFLGLSFVIDEDFKDGKYEIDQEINYSY